MSDEGEPDLGAAAMEEDDATGGGGGETGGFSGGGLGEWPDDDAEDRELCRGHHTNKMGAGSSAAPTASAGALKRRAEGMLYGSRSKKPKTSAAVTKRREAAAKAARFQKAPKQPPMVSA